MFDGDLKKAGVEVLQILPRVSSAGVKISEHIESKTDFFNKESEKNFNAFDDSMQGLLALWNGLDIEIGQVGLQLKLLVFPSSPSSKLLPIYLICPEYRPSGGSGG